MKEQWCIPPQGNGEFVWKMEDVLEVYRRPYDPKRPVVAVDEKSKQLLSDARPPLPAEPGPQGAARRQDYEYERRGTANIFVASQPLANWRTMTVTDRRTKQDFARFIAELVDGRYKEADKIVLVMDNLNTHTPASFYETFSPAEARRLTDKLEIHHTPKHGSWLNVAEIELSVASRRLSGRIDEKATLQEELDAISTERNQLGRGVDWQFTADNARIKLKRLYPTIEVR